MMAFINKQIHKLCWLIPERYLSWAILLPGVAYIFLHTAAYFSLFILGLIFLPVAVMTYRMLDELEEPYSQKISVTPAIRLTLACLLSYFVGWGAYTLGYHAFESI
ncbi:MAG: hypothetical protein ACR2N8_01805 [Parvibaculales bacterium]